MPDDVFLDFAGPLNRHVLSFLRIEEAEKAATYTPAEVDWWRLGTHPDLVEYFWRLGRDLPFACACVINERSYPLLAHPVSGVIFGLAGGTSTLAFRLPEPERSKMLAVPGYGASYRYPNSTVYAADMGDDWVLIKPFSERNLELCRRAFEYAEALEAPV